MNVVDTSRVTVDHAACARVARLLKTKRIPEDREEISFPGFDKPSLGNLLLFSVAICHQTSPRDFPSLEGSIRGKYLRGWDYLLQRIVTEAKSDPSLLIAANWQKMTVGELKRTFESDDGNSSLYAPEGRVELINDLGATMGRHRWQTLHDIYEECEGRIATGDPNLLQSLSEFRAYNDPVKKKSFFLLSLMRNTGMWKYSDQEHLGPPVDYHEVRGHLRIGTVRVMDPELKHKLYNRLSVTAEDDVAIRTAVLDAIMLIGELSELRNPSQLHYLFWNVLRNYCTRNSPNCFGHRRETYLPNRYQSLAIHSDGTVRCPFSDICESAGVAKLYYEHIFDTDYY